MNRIWILVLVAIILLSGCHQKGTVGDTKLYEPFRIADANIPLADNLHTSQFDRVTELETDAYGRRHFSYKTYPAMYAGQVEIHIICQMTKDDKVYYYPDYCYLIRTEDAAAFTEEDITSLKEWNDWDRPLDENKMCTTSYSEYHKDVANEGDIRSAVLAYLELDDSYGVLRNGLESLNKNEQLFIVNVFPRDSNGKATARGDYYVILYNSRFSQPVKMCERLDNPLSCQEQIHAFRDACLGIEVVD